MYQDVAAAICRPGIGTVTDCLLNSVRILAVSEPENLEVQNNGRILGELGLGELCMTFADAYRRAHAYMDNTLARDAQREAISRQISFQGHREAVDFCERQLQNL